MKGQSVFSPEEAVQIEALIAAKLKAPSDKQKGIRDKIRKLGFYASDFNVGNGYTVQDFRRVVRISGKPVSPSMNPPVKPVQVAAPKTVTVGKRSTSDEAYILDLCDEVLQQKSLRQHRFDFLRGDSGTRLPVDAFYPNLNLVIEYRERQHSEEVKFFDKRITSSGVSRGEQRKLYDERRRSELPKHGIKLLEFDYSEFGFEIRKRLVREREEDFKIIKKKLLSIN